MRLSVLSLAALASGALASGDTIEAAIHTIDESTLALNEDVAQWNGKLLGVLPIVKDSTSLLTDINDGKKAATDSEPLDFGETIQVAGATIQLATDVNTTLEAVIQAKPKFDKLHLSPIILVNLKLQQHSTDKFSNAVVEKVPQELQETAKQLVAGIADSFDKAIDAYALF